MSRVVVQVNLLSGRYHAHPWGEAQHAMGGPEWPPSPWRLLRGLAAAWFDANPPPATKAERDNLLEALGRASPPIMWLSAVSFSEIPYYQPIVESGKPKRVLHFDHFAVLSETDAGGLLLLRFRCRPLGPAAERTRSAAYAHDLPWTSRIEGPSLARAGPTGKSLQGGPRRWICLVG